MTKLTTTSIAAVAVLGLLLLGRADAGNRNKRSPEARTTLAAIEANLGFVPDFIDQLPDEALPTAWAHLESLEFNPDTALSAKVKELIVVAVAGQVPCHYCTYAGTKLARAAGATDAELKEAIIVASHTRHWSTLLNGLNYPYKQFVREIDSAFAYVTSGKHGRAPATVATEADALADIEALFGSVPEFFRKMPGPALAPMWNSYKTVVLAPNTQLPCKEKELIGLAVAAQIPCRYCVYSHTKAARLLGATDQEVREALAMSAAVRFWSTYFNGAQIDDKRFRREVDRLTAPHPTAKR